MHVCACVRVCVCVCACVCVLRAVCCVLCAACCVLCAACCVLPSDAPSPFPPARLPRQDPRVERLPCSHRGTYADDCICERVSQHKCYIVATCDRDLRRRIRKVCVRVFPCACVRVRMRVRARVWCVCGLVGLSMD